MFREEASANTTRSASSSGAGTIAASLAAIGSVLAASICCLPLFPFVLAAGLAGTSGFVSEIRPYLLAGSVLFIALGFYQVRRARKCRRRTSIVASVLLGLSAGFVLISIFFPQVIANAIAGPGTR
jgi:cytochrome bd-type quinol oxidase subunit 2